MNKFFVMLVMFFVFGAVNICGAQGSQVHVPRAPSIQRVQSLIPEQQCRRVVYVQRTVWSEQYQQYIIVQEAHVVYVQPEPQVVYDTQPRFSFSFGFNTGGHRNNDRGSHRDRDNNNYRR